MVLLYTNHIRFANSLRVSNRINVLCPSTSLNERRNILSRKKVFNSDLAFMQTFLSLQLSDLLPENLQKLDVSIKSIVRAGSWNVVNSLVT